MSGARDGGASSGGGAGGAAQQAAEDACTTMQAALAALKDSKDASCPAPSRQQLQAASQAVRMEVAKTGLLYNQPSPPSDAEATALLAGFQQAACTLCMLYTGLAAAPGAGPTLRASLHQTATSVVEACAALIRGAVVGGAREAQLMMLSGFALEMLDAAGRAPLDSRTAVGRAITRVLKQLADAQKELDEAIAEAAAEEATEDRDSNGAAVAGAEAPAAASSDADSDVGFGFQQEAFSGVQLEVARRARAMLAAVTGVVKAAVKLLLAEREALSPEGVEGWESILFHVKALAPVCDDLAAAVYPPQDAEELSAAAESLATGCDLLCDECPLPEAASSGEAEGAAAAAAPLRAALEAVQQAQEQLSQQLVVGREAAAE